MSDYDRTQDIDEIVHRYLSRMPGAREAYHHDPAYHSQIKFMRSVFIGVDMAMEDEGVPVETRRRVLRSVMFGAPEPGHDDPGLVLPHERLDDSIERIRIFSESDKQRLEDQLREFEERERSTKTERRPTPPWMSP